MNKDGQVRHSKQVNIIFSLLLIMLIFVYTSTIIILKGFDLTILWISSLFIACMIAVGVAWVWSLRRQITAFTESMNELVDSAVNGRKLKSHYEETSLSLMEHKLMRYIDISRSNEQNIIIEKNKIKGLISDISHQTKTPLSNIMVYSQLLAEKPGLDEENRHFINSIQAQSQKLDWLIASLIKLSRLETGMISLEIALHPVIQMITKSVAQVFSQAESKRIDISITCNTLISACYDLKWTSEALFNVLENAVKYTQQGGNIHLSAERNEMFTRIDISDTGIGIEPEELKHIFKRFYRGNNVGEIDGIGIGLFLAREIVTAQGGHIKVDSVLGKGTVFSIYLSNI
ncbi:HAMP domain-containing histidine kinase [Paenibacillus sp. 19GGS1-52]|uniref:sensor histidine kinase n=1 Tax=Paenibacillus sp. 19GGS1-52 TaxID=2758563 RepID=UPI001EFAC429|nr:HAMP domain-containing sensor histidine kinase [Paenibacillus sp. 19GGS1-52]ULO08316.1 HAMP domain-containing histidine kinase [Paenibacillus sp. 19GGS1-52]